MIARPALATGPGAVALAASLIAIAADPAMAQRGAAVGPGEAPVSAVVAGPVFPPTFAAPQPTERTDSWWSPVASAVVPGSGQLMLRQDRAIAYLAAEAYGWIRFAADIREARRQRSAYRQLAATVARAYFSEQKPSGNFEYYERMEHFVESGVFDASALDGTQPETDPETFNGSLWFRARSTFWEDPTVPPPPDSDPYLSAVRYYEERAIRPDFRWSWRDAQLEQDLFRRTIDRSNDAYRRSLQDLGVILANHVLSTVDAYVTLRIRQLGPSRGRVGVVGSIPWSPDLGFGSGSPGGR